MPVITYLGYLALGVFSGLVGGFVGIGGGIIIIPALTLFFGYDQRSAQGTALATLLLPIGFLSFWEYWKNPEVRINLWIAGVMAFGFFIGGYFGGKGANLVPDVNLLRRCFAVFLACVSAYLFLVKR